jgi:hypothetical protein
MGHYLRMTDLERSHAELRGCLKLAEQRILKLNRALNLARQRGRGTGGAVATDPLLPTIRRVLREAREVGGGGLTWGTTMKRPTTGVRGFRTISADPGPILREALCEFFGIQIAIVNGEETLPGDLIQAMGDVLLLMPEDVRGEFTAAVVGEYLKAKGGSAHGYTLKAIPHSEWENLPALKEFALSRYRQLVGK